MVTRLQQPAAATVLGRLHTHMLRACRDSTSTTSQRHLCLIRMLLLPVLQEDYDVYLAEQQPLQEGEEKHIISVFVADESGLINRVAGVFARRGE